MEKPQRRNGWVDLWRFLAALCILCVHLPAGLRGAVSLPGASLLMPAGYLYVEFFFLVSGYLAAAHAERWPQQEPCEMRIGGYMAQKYRYFLCVAGPCVVLEYISNNAWAHVGFWDNVRILLGMPAEFLLLKASGINPYTLAGPLWYLSALLLALPVVLYLAVRCHDIFRAYLVWALPPVCYGWLLMTYGNFDCMAAGSCLVRAFAGLCLGAGLRYIVVHLAQYSFTGPGRALMTLWEAAAMLGTLVLAGTDLVPSPTRDLAFLLLTATALVSAFLGQSGTARLQGRAFTLLGKISFPLYCCHSLVIEQVDQLAKRITIPVSGQFGLILAGSLLAAVLLLWIAETLFPWLGQRLKSALIRKDNACVR